VIYESEKNQSTSNVPATVKIAAIASRYKESGPSRRLWRLHPAVLKKQAGRRKGSPPREPFLLSVFPSILLWYIVNCRKKKDDTVFDINTKTDVCLKA